MSCFIDALRQFSTKLLLAFIFLVSFARESVNAQTVNSISPSAIVAGSPSTTVTLTGGSFTTGSVVVLNGSESLLTTFVSASEIRVLLPDARLATPGLLRLTATGGGPWILTVYSLAAPKITSVSPDSVTLRSTVSLTITGTDLLGSDLRFDSPDFLLQSVTGTDTSLTVSLSIGANAILGSRVLTLSKPNGASSTTSIQLFDGGSWQTLSIPNQSNGSLTTLLDGRILLAGGVQTNNAAWLIDPSTFSSINVSPLITPRSAHQSILLPDGRVLVVGGTTANGVIPLPEIFDPQSRSWSPAGYIRNSSASPILLPSGKVLFLPDEIYDPATLTSTTVKGSGHKNGYTGFGQRGVLRPDGSVYVTDGTFAVLYDPLGDSAQTIPSPGVSFCTSVRGCVGTKFLFPDIPILLPDGRIFGSVSNVDGFAAGSLNYYYDPVTNVSTRSYLWPGSFKTARLLSTGNVMLFGGFEGGTDTAAYPYFDSTHQQIGIIDSASGRVNLLSTFPVSSVGPTAILNDGRLLFGASAVIDSSTHRPLLGPAQAAVYSPATSVTSTPIVNSVTVFDSRPGGDLTVRIAGSNFSPNSIASVGNVPLRTLYAGANALFAFVPAGTASTSSDGIIVSTAGNSSVSVALGGSFQPQPSPVITSITPATGAQGSSLSVLVAGSNLSGVTSIVFSGTGVTASVQPGVTGTQVPVIVTVAQDAMPSVRTVTISTPAGAYTLNSAFTVQRANAPATLPQPITTVEQGPIHSGYAVLTPDSNSGSPAVTVTFGMVSNGTVQSQAGMFPGPTTTDASLFADVIPGIGRLLGIALANPNNSASTLTLTLRDSNGAAAGSAVTITLQPKQQLARFINELFPADVIGAAFQGNFRVQGSSPFAILGLRFTATEFSTLPSTFNATTSGNTIVLPQFAIGGGWATQIALSNGTGSTISGRIDILDSSGNPMAVKLNGATQSTFTYSIPAGGSFVLAPRDSNGQSPF